MGMWVYAGKDAFIVYSRGDHVLDVDEGIWTSELLHYLEGRSDYVQSIYSNCFPLMIHFMYYCPVIIITMRKLSRKSDLHTAVNEIVITWMRKQ